MATTSSSRTHRLRRGAAVYATGFVVTPAQMAAMARVACPPAFIKRHGDDLVFALMWWVSRHKYEIHDGAHPGERFFAVDFFPWLGDPQDAPASVRALSAEKREAWFEAYGQHAGTDYEERTVKYPNGGVEYFIEKRVRQVIVEADLWDLLEPAVPAHVRAALAVKVAS
ncbi:hypothetical protein B0H15DRAFT_953767 [Mycena belliarum]|uniref:Uncharacterized protein n=1 Tax=Mycena belliarum TaxID=1033014 RepID=A0AAD6XHU0_9AGAR|nr:hypothetical protein B0H15DRAFT_953767 [Mycena belliae]